MEYDYVSCIHQQEVILNPSTLPKLYGFPDELAACRGAVDRDSGERGSGALVLLLVTFEIGRDP